MTASSRGKDHDGKERGRIAFQGSLGAYSEIACGLFAPDLDPLPCGSFDAALDAVTEGRAIQAMLPVENSLAGRVADIHRLLPETDLQIIAEHFLSIRHQLLTLPGVDLKDVRRVRSHAMALGQCLGVINELGMEAEAAGDTAGAAKRLAETGERTEAVIASARAAELYGLQVARANVEDAGHNTTRFLLMAREPADVEPGEGPIVTSFVFQVRNIPAALYKALGGFATNGVNMTKLESYMREGSFTATMFYADVEGHPEDPPLRRALEELSFFSSSFKVLGVYRADARRLEIGG
ncbi:MAG: prephenate dehydratase [Alphaproteobacteria bacterium]|nr:prephenate dehydratase [Alphaproteobacteria bacterium]